MSKGLVRTMPGQVARKPLAMDCHTASFFPSPSFFCQSSSSTAFLHQNMVAWFRPLRHTVGIAPFHIASTPWWVFVWMQVGNVF